VDMDEPAANLLRRDPARVGIGHCGEIGRDELPETMNDKMGLSDLVMAALKLSPPSLNSQRRVPVLDCSWFSCVVFFPPFLMQDSRFGLLVCTIHAPNTEQNNNLRPK